MKKPWLPALLCTVMLCLLTACHSAAPEPGGRLSAALLREDPAAFLGHTAQEIVPALGASGSWQEDAHWVGGYHPQQLDAAGEAAYTVGEITLTFDPDLRCVALSFPPSAVSTQKAFDGVRTEDTLQRRLEDAGWSVTQTPREDWEPAAPSSALSLCAYSPQHSGVRYDYSGQQGVEMVELHWLEAGRTIPDTLEGAELSQLLGLSKEELRTRYNAVSQYQTPEGAALTLTFSEDGTQSVLTGVEVRGLSGMTLYGRAVDEDILTQANAWRKNLGASIQLSLPALQGDAAQLLTLTPRAQCALEEWQWSHCLDEAGRHLLTITRAEAYTPALYPPQEQTYQAACAALDATYTAPEGGSVETLRTDLNNDGLPDVLLLTTPGQYSGTYQLYPLLWQQGGLEGAEGEAPLLSLRLTTGDVNQCYLVQLQGLRCLLVYEEALTGSAALTLYQFTQGDPQVLYQCSTQERFTLEQVQQARSTLVDGLGEALTPLLLSQPAQYFSGSASQNTFALTPVTISNPRPVYLEALSRWHTTGAQLGLPTGSLMADVTQDGTAELLVLFNTSAQHQDLPSSTLQVYTCQADGSMALLYEATVSERTSTDGVFYLAQRDGKCYLLRGVMSAQEGALPWYSLFSLDASGAPVEVEGARAESAGQAEGVIQQFNTLLGDSQALLLMQGLNHFRYTSPIPAQEVGAHSGAIPLDGVLGADQSSVYAVLGIWEDALLAQRGITLQFTQGELSVCTLTQPGFSIQGVQVGDSRGDVLRLLDSLTPLEQGADSLTYLLPSYGSPLSLHNQLTLTLEGDVVTQMTYSGSGNAPGV